MELRSSSVWLPIIFSLVDDGKYLARMFTNEKSQCMKRLKRFGSFTSKEDKVDHPTLVFEKANSTKILELKFLSTYGTYKVHLAKNTLQSAKYLTYIMDCTDMHGLQTLTVYGNSSMCARLYNKFMVGKCFSLTRWVERQKNPVYHHRTSEKSTRGASISSLMATRVYPQAIHVVVINTGVFPKIKIASSDNPLDVTMLYMHLEHEEQYHHIVADLYAGYMPKFLFFNIMKSMSLIQMKFRGSMKFIKHTVVSLLKTRLVDISFLTTNRASLKLKVFAHFALSQLLLLTIFRFQNTQTRNPMATSHKIAVDCIAQSIRELICEKHKLPLKAPLRTMDLSSEKFGERAQPVYKALSNDIVKNFQPQSSPSYGKLSHQELELLLCSIKSEPFIEDLLVPCLVPDVLTHRKKVEDAVVHARLMLLEADANIFYGSSFNYAKLKAAAKASVTEKQKLHDSSQLLWYSYSVFCLYFYLLRLAFLAYSSKSNAAFARMCDFDLKSILLGKPVTRERVCQAHILIDKVSPTPKEVYEALV
ncbi:hypothetical protein SELMODRAFT_417109 [Selaginella moellendorffii]|uniref:Uncharacterized protein n=1 Tax=Selaginella moellendorffii TaxID=88036 RepID=D8S1E4_SELML|nr:hypothetical protein SELMODRAFT_417109 [Selaginella moellendorffii]